jgi:hypothetical protein
VRNAETALQAHIDLAAEHGDAVPEPSELDVIAADPDVVEAAACAGARGCLAARYG